MTLASLLAISTLVASAQQGLAPALTVLEVSMPDTSNGICHVTLLNTNLRSAVAWVISRLPDRRSNRITDVTVSPELALAPGTARVTEVSWCREGEPPPAVEAIAVLYDDGSRSGDDTVLERHLFAGQRQRASRLRELATLLSAAQPSVKPDVPVSEAFRELIDQAAGPQIDGAARQFARFALQRAAQQHASGGPASAQQIDAVKRALVAELATAVARLEKSSRVR
jgi:hypothetical protein